MSDLECTRCHKRGHEAKDCGATLVVSTNPLRGVSLADALLDEVMNYTDEAKLADVVWAWFRANRDTLEEQLWARYGDWDGPMFDALLDAATRLGVEERTPRP